MAIKINLGAYALQNNETLTQRIQFIYSPLNELFRSLHVLLNPRHHGVNIDWALTARQHLSSNFFNDLHYFPHWPRASNGKVLRSITPRIYWSI